METEKKMKIAMFRFSIIADFVNGRRLEYGEKEELLSLKENLKYEIPFSTKTDVSRESILNWIRIYNRGGKRLESLFPQTRKDKGEYHSLSPALRLSIKEIKKENPNLKLPAIIRELKHRKIIEATAKVNYATIYRFLKNETICKPNTDAVDRRKFEAEYPNEVWQSDIMHGPYVKEGARKQKSYLIGIIDDHSRLIVHAEFYLSEGLSNLRVALKEAFLRRGLPQTLYIDNGACYKSVHLEQITASLGISVKHTPPYTPQGRGKIERWFKYVRDNFMPMFKGGNLNELNMCFEKWVEEYNNRKHSSINETPLERYKRNMQCVRPSPKDIMLYFRRVDKRLVKKDRTFRLNGNTYEAPAQLIDRKIEVKYDECDAQKVEIYFDGMSFGNAGLVDAHINAKLGRNWLQPHNKIKSEEPTLNPEAQIKSGELKFTAKADDDGGF